MFSVVECCYTSSEVSSPVTHASYAIDYISCECAGDSEDPVGDFIAINQELELFNPKLVTKPQVVVINKIDIPEVRLLSYQHVYRSGL